MKDIPLYKEEKALASLIRDNRSFSYSQLVEPATDKIKAHLSKLPEVVKASHTDKDLYYHQSILVSTSRNLNDDVFLPVEVWAARNTPTHKPTNLNHNELDIVGHICSNFAVDSEVNLIDDNSTIDELPSTFHILTSSVIYQLWQDEDKRKAVSELIEKINAGEMYCSMECILNNFDYMLDNGKEQKIIARNQSTAFLTQFLRIYGGAGEFQDYKVYRVLRDITFSGKGYTEKPANPDSVTFSKDDLLDFSSAKLIQNKQFLNEVGVSLNERVENAELKTENIMADDIYKEQVEKLEAEKKSLATELKSVKDQLAKADVDKYEAKIKSLTDEVAEATNSIKSKSDELVSANKQVEELTSKIDELTKANKEFEDKFSKLEAERVIEKRVASLVEVGVDKAEATKIVEKYADASDEIFADKVETEKKLVEARKDDEDDKKKKMKEKMGKATEKVIRVEADDDEEDEAAEAELDKAEVEDKPDLAVADTKDEDIDLSNLRKAIAGRLKFSKNYTESK